MLIVNRPAFLRGCLLGISFCGVLALLFAPVFGSGQNGLQYADNMFNRLSKGSSYFMPKVARSNAGVAGTAVSLDLQLESPAIAQEASRILAAAGATVERRETNLKLGGDLGQLLDSALRDAEAGYRNDEAALRQRYDMPAQASLVLWWRVLRQMDKALKQQHRLAEARAVHEVMKKAVEPAHNYFGIEAVAVGEMAGTMTALLLFYVFYTIWWGYAIFYLFEGVGLVMKKRPEAKQT